MKHGSSHLLYAHWKEKRGRHVMPDRSDIDPGSIRQALGDCFILAFDASAGHPFCLAGTRLCDLFGRELRDEPFVGLWLPEDKANIRHLLYLVAYEVKALVAGVTGLTGGKDTIELELLVLPLRHQGKPRHIGVLAPFTRPLWLKQTPLVALWLESFRYLVA
jgi:hypothetical protein